MKKETSNYEFSQEFTVQATFHVPVIPRIHTNLAFSLPKKNKQSSLTNHFGQQSVTLTEHQQFLCRAATSNLKLPTPAPQPHGFSAVVWTLEVRLYCVDWAPDHTLWRAINKCCLLERWTSQADAIHLQAQLPESAASSRFASTVFPQVENGFGINASLVHVYPEYCKRKLVAQ